jgi:hypothetical protein
MLFPNESEPRYLGCYKCRSGLLARVKAGGRQVNAESDECW